MKILNLIIICCLFTTITFAQQKDPKTDSLLVEYYQTQRFAEAADYLKKIYPEPVQNPKIISQLAYTSNMAGRLPDAEGYYQRLYDVDSTSQSTLFSMAGINMRRGNNTKAASFYKRILKIDSTNFNVYKQLALISQSDVVAELGYLQKANHLNPQDANIAVDLSTLLIQFKQEATAEKVIDQALQADTANLLLLKGKAQVSYTLKKFVQTINICSKLLANDDRSSQTISYKGISEFNLKNYSDCIKTFHMLDTTQAQNESSYYYLGMSYKALKQDTKAIFYLQRAIEQAISPNTDTYYSEIADSYDRLHLPKKALAAYQRGLIFGEKPIVYYAMASIYDSNLKDTMNAVKYYKKYLSVKPPVEKQQSYIDFTTRRIVDLKR
ncbi:tetratricopeptide repeat protein [Mucilaginibacter jinjuensis]|uniref:Tetratricopeptide repeat protein n=1 Tax=Mucilaginibacter jinjuensis TaxID=1176721 RepID=A0ABY7T324_9SPHI|nr:tetratricopeptide repeat protein [Mucilaginibacter jinjuensis]WCT10786.1 tetratricopeptide repeat protein [Mucilaginibacter jinjuensis]